MYEINFLRHGESEGVERGILQGHLDLPLTEKGKAQILALALHWQTHNQHFDQIFSSPLERARQTAEIIATRLGFDYSLDPIWTERNFGMCEGVDTAIVADWYAHRPRPAIYEPVYETGEAEWELHLRAGQAIDRLMKLPQGSYLVVSHGNFISAALRMIFGILPYGRSWPVELKLDPGCFARLIYRPNNARWSLVSFNEHI